MALGGIVKKFKKINLNINLKEVLNFMPDIDFNINLNINFFIVLVLFIVFPYSLKVWQMKHSIRQRYTNTSI